MATTSTAASGLEQAIREYSLRFGPPDNIDPQKQQDLERRIQDANIDFQKWRALHGGFWNALQACIAPIVMIGGLAKDATNVYVPPASIVLGGVIGLIQDCEKVKKAYDAVEDMFRKLEDLLQRWETFAESQKELPDRLLKIAPVLASLTIAIIARARVLISQGRIGRYFRNMVKGGDEETMQLFQDLEELILSQNVAIADSTFSRLNQSWRKLLSIEQQLGEIQDHQKRDRTEKRLRSIKTENYDKTHATYRRILQEMIDSTGLWLRQERSFEDWLAHKRPLLAILGGPGLGKSFLAASTIKYVDEAASPDVSLAFYFVGGDDERFRNVNEMLKTMAYDLQRSNSAFRDHLLRVIEQDDGLWTAEQTWTNLFEAFWKDDFSNDRLILVVDGLDEASAKEQGVFGDILRRSTTRTAIQLAIFGRFSLLSTLRLQDSAAVFDLSVGHLREEFAKYVRRGLDQARCARLNKGRRDEWESKIVNKTQGIFESARQVIINIQDMEAYRVDAFLEKPLDSLDRIIGLSLEIMRAEQALEPSLLQCLLTWLTYSRRPLSLGELYEILRVHDGHEHEFLLYSLRYKLRPIVECVMFSVESAGSNSGLVREKPEQKAPEEWTETELMLTTVSLGHEGIRDYLKSRVTPDAWETYGPDASEAEVVKGCLQLLQQQTGSKRLSSQVPYRLVYPSLFLVTHLRALEWPRLTTEEWKDIQDGLRWLLWDENGQKTFLTAAALNFQTFVETWFFDNEATITLQKFVTASPPSGTLERSQNLVGMGVLLQHCSLFVMAFLSWIWFMAIGTRHQITDGQAIAESDSRNKQVCLYREKDDWLRSARNSCSSLYEPLRIAAARAWLLSDPISSSGREVAIAGQKMVSCIFILIILHDMDELGQFKDGCTTMSLRKRTLVKLTAHELQALALQQELDQTKDWHLNLAFILQWCAYYFEAAEEYHKVLEEDEECVLAVWRLAQCYSEMYDYDNTVKWTERLGQMSTSTSTQREDMSFRLLRLKGDDEAAVKPLREAYLRDKSEDNATRYLLQLDRSGDYAKMTEVLLDLQEIIVPGKSYSRLAQLFGNFATATTWAYKAFAAQKGTPVADRLLAAFRSTKIDVTPTYLQLPWERNYNLFQYAHTGRTLQETIQTHEALLDRTLAISAQPGGADMTRFAYQTSILLDLAQLYYLNLSGRGGNVPSAETLNIEEKMSQVVRQCCLLEQSGLNQYPSGYLLYPLFLCGRHLREKNPHDESVWRVVLRDILKPQIAMLETKSAVEVPQSVIIVTNLLFHAGDTSTAVALSGFPMKYNQQSSSIASTGASSGTTRSRSPSAVGSNATRLAANGQLPLLSPHSTSLSPSSQTSTPSLSPPIKQSSQNRRSPSPTPNPIYPHVVCPVCTRSAREIDEYFICTVCMSAGSCGRCRDRRHHLYGALCPDEHLKVQIWPIDPHVEETVMEEGGDGRPRIKRTFLTALKSEWGL